MNPANGPHEPTENQLSDDPFADAEPFPPKVLSPLAHRPPLSALRPSIYLYAAMVLISGLHWNKQFRHLFYASYETTWQRGEIWRWLTALFAHSDLHHLLSNTAFFLIFGWMLYAYFGKRAFPLLAVVIGVLTNAATVYFYGGGTRLVGASGMIYGMVALWLVLYVLYDTEYSYFIRAMRALAFALVLLFPTTFHQETSYLAHGLGFLLGLGLTLLCVRWMKPSGIQY